MPESYHSIVSLIDSVKVGKSYVTCNFKGKEKDEIISSTVPFEPYDGAIIITWKDILFHPIQSYNRYYHTPITIYGDENDKTVVYKAFKKVSKHFIWNREEQKYIHK